MIRFGALFLFCVQPALANDVSFLRDLVSISSGTADVAGVNAVQAKIAERLKPQGFTVEFFDHSEGADRAGKMLVATFAGKTAKFVTFVSHADTVFEKLNAWEVSADGKQAKGSGTSDDKGGIVVGITAMEAFLKKGLPRFSLRFVVTASEEIGSMGFRDRLKKFSEDSIAVLGLESALDNGNVISSRKGVRWYHIKVTGKEAHAGVKHADGINACHDLTMKLDRIQKLTDYRNGSTVSIGRMEGGKDKFNIVCGDAQAKVDTRFADEKRSQKLDRAIRQILEEPAARSFNSNEATKTEIQVIVELPPLAESKATRPLLAKYQAIVAEIEGKSIQAEATGGAADLNFMARPGVHIIDGLGPIGGLQHTAEEYVVLDSMKSRSDALARLLEHIDAPKPGPSNNP